MLLRFFGLCIAAGLAWIPADAKATDHAPYVDRAVDHWLTTQRQNGLLPYGYDLLADRETEKDELSEYNLARQAFAISVLAHYFAIGQQSGMSPEKTSRIGDALKRGLSALGRHSIPLGKSRLQSWAEAAGILRLPFGRYKLRSGLDHLGLLYVPAGRGLVISPDRGYGNAHLNTIAVALLAELDYSAASGDQQFADLRRGWRTALVMLHVPGGGFRATPAVIEGREYPDGQGWLALAHYLRRFPDDREVRDVLIDAEQALLARYGSAANFDFFHWGAMAAAARYRDTLDNRLLDFLRSQASLFLDDWQSRVSADDNNCYLMEGMADILNALRLGGDGDSPLARRIADWLDRETDKTIGLQIEPGQIVRRFASDAELHAPRMVALAGDFLAGRHAPTTRVDFTAHCVSALLKRAEGAPGSP